MFKKILNILTSRLKNRGHNKVKISKKISGHYKISLSGSENILSVGKNCKCKNLLIKIRGQNNRVEIKDNFNCKGLCEIYVIGSNSEVTIGENVMVVTSLKIYEHDNGHNCQIHIGNSCSFYKTEIHNYDNGASIHIGEDCMFAYDTVVYNTDGHSVFSNGVLSNQAKELSIGNHVWIGWGASILKNSKIADGVIIGKNTTIAGIFDELNCAVVGNPAHVVKRGISWDRKSVNEYQKEHE